MKIDNETEDDVDYNQTGGGGGHTLDEFLALIKDPPATGPGDDVIWGTLPPIAEVMFTPTGSFDYIAVVTNDFGGCYWVQFTDPATVITVRDLRSNPPDVEVNPAPTATGTCT
ncbi:MAG TPA: hypothetical protein VHQ65_10450 [Thermoanaerobaculia bacterium]|nr:hypothetical protein [Thermoanaerobaculia bacterium]